MKSLTDRQTRVVVFIGWYIGRNGWAPTYREIAAHCGLKSISSVDHQLNVLESRGMIRRGPHAAIRALALTDGGAELVVAVHSAMRRHPASARRAAS